MTRPRDIFGRATDLAAYGVIAFVASLGLAILFTPSKPRPPAPKFTLRIDPDTVSVVSRSVPTLVSEPGR